MPAKTARKPAAKKPAARPKPTARKPAARPATRSGKLVPLGDRILVQQVRQNEVRASGLVIPDTAREKPQMGAVLAVGPGRLDDSGKRVNMDVNVGDRVLYAKYTGQEVPRGVLGAEDEEFLILKESDILAKLG
ncbi:MAG: co-chaperone GroES [Dehalococcoidia bacterium]